MHALQLTRLCICLAIWMPLPVLAEVDNWIVMQITHDEAYDFSPAVQDSKILWRYGVPGNLGLYWHDLDTHVTELICPMIGRMIQGHAVFDDHILLSASNTYYYDGLEWDRLWDNPDHPYGGTSRIGLWESNAAWQGYYDDVWVYDGQAVSSATFGLGSTRVSSLDLQGENVAWIGRAAAYPGDTIFVYNIASQSLTPLNAPAGFKSDVHIYGSYVVWQHQNSFQDSEIFLMHLGTETITQITDNDVPDGDIDFFGEIIVWVNQGDLYLYEIDPGRTERITATADTSDFNPVVSNSHVVWKRSDSSGYGVSVYEIASENITNFPPLPDGFTNFFPKVWGDTLTWQIPGPNDTYEIVVAVPKPAPRPDLNRDGHVDVIDFDRFQPCVSGPAVPHPPSCDPSDFDDDGDVDLADFGLFQRCLTGPDAPVDPQCMG